MTYDTWKATDPRDGEYDEVEAQMLADEEDREANPEAYLTGDEPAAAPYIISDTPHKHAFMTGAASVIIANLVRDLTQAQAASDSAAMGQRWLTAYNDEL